MNSVKCYFFLFVLALLSILLLSGCTREQASSSAEQASDSVEKTSLFFTQENYPRIDGSTANIPLGVVIAQRMLGLSAEEADATINFSTTPGAYTNLLYNNADLLLVYPAAEETQQEIDNSGVELEFYPIGVDALVFIVNEQNPVAALSVEEIQAIYQGRITNWQEVGGKDEEIVAFQRTESSGSQALMRKLVMPGLAMTEAPIEFKPSEMGELIESLADYNNAGNAIGYSVYYYAQNMYQQPGLKFLAIDGTTPNNASIADQTYPFTSPFYAVIRRDEPEGTPARILLDWILSPEGIEVIEEVGYVAVK